MLKTSKCYFLYNLINNKMFILVSKLNTIFILLKKIDFYYKQGHDSINNLIEPHKTVTKIYSANHKVTKTVKT